MTSFTSSVGALGQVEWNRENDLKFIRLRHELKGEINPWEIIANTFHCSKEESKKHFKELLKSSDQTIQDAFSKYPPLDKRCTADIGNRIESTACLLGQDSFEVLRKLLVMQEKITGKKRKGALLQNSVPAEERECKRKYSSLKELDKAEPDEFDEKKDALLVDFPDSIPSSSANNCTASAPLSKAASGYLEHLSPKAIVSSAIEPDESEEEEDPLLLDFPNETPSSSDSRSYTFEDFGKPLESYETPEELMKEWGL